MTANWLQSRHQQARRRSTVGRVQRGFSLLEVLIAVFVLSFGMLGMVGMQSFSLQANRQARLASTAAGLVREMGEMMRGNKDQALLTSSNPYVGNFTAPLTPTTAEYCLSVSNASIGCTSALAIANAQMTEWLSRVNAELPSPRVQICFDNQPYDSNNLPQWGCNGTGAGDLVMYIKIAWTQTSTDRSDTGSAAFVQASTRPILIVPITAGNS